MRQGAPFGARKLLPALRFQSLVTDEALPRTVFHRGALLFSLEVIRERVQNVWR